MQANVVASVYAKVVVADKSQSKRRCVVGQNSRAVVGSKVVGAALAAGEAVAADGAAVVAAAELAVVADVVAMVINCALHVVCCFALRRLVVRWIRGAIVASTGSGSCGRSSCGKPHTSMMELGLGSSVPMLVGLVRRLTANLLLSLLEVAKSVSLEAAAAEVGATVGPKGCRNQDELRRLEDLALPKRP